MARSEPVALESLSTEEPGGPTVMAKAHANGLRKTLARMKAHLKQPEKAEDLVKAGLLTYLEEWEKTYAEGVDEAVTQVTRTILVIRQDTIAQAIRELKSS